MWILTYNKKSQNVIYEKPGEALTSFRYLIVLGDYFKCVYDYNIVLGGVTDIFDILIHIGICTKKI